MVTNIYTTMMEQSKNNLQHNNKLKNKQDICLRRKNIKQRKTVAIRQPELKQACIEWFDDFITFATKNYQRYNILIAYSLDL